MALGLSVHHFALIVALFFAVADDRHDGHDDRDVRRRTPRFRRSVGNIRHDMTREVAGLANRMDMHSVGHFACHSQHPRIHRGDIDFRVGSVDGSRTPLRSNEVEVVEVAVVIERPGAERREARLHGEQVVAQPGTGPLEGHPIAPHDVGAHLRTQTQPELPARCFLNSHAVAAVTKGLRGKATATPVDNSRPGAACDATAGLTCHKVTVTVSRSEGRDVEAWMGLTAKGGGCVVTAMGSVMATDVTRNLAGLSLLQKSLQGSLFGGGNPQYDIPEILALYKMGQINLDDMVTREYRLEQINDGYRDMLEGRNIRGVIGSPTPTALAFSLLRPTSSCRCVTWKYIGAQRT